MSEKKLPPEFEHAEKKNDEQQQGQRALTRRDFVKIAGAAGAVAAGGLFPTLASAAAPKPKMAPPVISCNGANATSITIHVCGGAVTGAPAGFTLQWETLAQYTAGGWGAQEVCGGSFSGNANSSQYTLAPGECVDVQVGDLLFDNGVSTTCPDPLLCDTVYVFRAFAHADSTHIRSDFTSTIQCHTEVCTGELGHCTYTQGYWKNHNPVVCLTDPLSPLCVLWPVIGLTLGNVNYDVDQLLSIFETPAGAGKGGNGLLTLAHQLIATKLNIANGSDGSVVASCIAEADNLIGALVIPPVGGGYLAPSDVSFLVTCLDNFNQGVTGPGHCPS